MKLAFLAAALACAPTIAVAQRLPGHSGNAIGTGPAAPCGYADTDGTLVLCSPTTPLPVTVISGSISGGDASSANQTAVQAAPGGDATKATAVQGVTGGKAVGVTALSLPLPAGAATAANQGTANASLASIATSAAQGRDSGGRLLPGQGVVTSTRTTLTASIATPIEAAGVSARIGAVVTVEAAPTAPIFLCTTQATSCSATAYDFLIASGVAAGTSYTFLFATTGRLYAYSTAATPVILNSWTGQ